MLTWLLGARSHSPFPVTGQAYTVFLFFLWRGNMYVGTKRKSPGRLFEKYLKLEHMMLLETEPIRRQSSRRIKQQILRARWNGKTSFFVWCKRNGKCREGYSLLLLEKETHFNRDGFIFQVYWKNATFQAEFVVILMKTSVKENLYTGVILLSSAKICIPGHVWREWRRL